MAATAHSSLTVFCIANSSLSSSSNSSLESSAAARSATARSRLGEGVSSLLLPLSSSISNLRRFLGDAEDRLNLIEVNGAFRDVFEGDETPDPGALVVIKSADCSPGALGCKDGMVLEG
jgi:hypothetical protein